ncbi:tyrosine-type recombinase/integrase [Ralstonia solanacearum P673]|uniref:tyrosine-type recombinase/integrase n=2 Tax=Pseudomonadota TaxID=1224 RepID=UPI000448BC2F|nr:integrase arm-type DNA-binding domain-containing protein [Ralstonia solanacearum]EUJ15159.1 integrase [Ralstonia solanacearum P673]MCL9851186.1 integrase arm-type DNA-binding domain-containing protein [Ralstonia solanacearum]MCL9855763.1 integrase arm-type DNA-binding domain-containing protein [Ralstonia solanacearum]MCL9860279.1 integrase arm-type DNA-binding domain-containing protein [Ralstonia solanacearum]MCL9865510.1 integrase arm-type DNA-binding domain-containing protein [Ralstonia s
MPLTDTAIRNTKPAEKPIKLFDGGGLFLHITPAGQRYWRLKYRFAGKEKLLALGVYPDVGLKEARDRREEAKRLLGEGIDPSVERKVQKVATVERAANSFEAVAREWHGKYAPGWSESNSKKVLARLENDVFPWLGGRPIAELKAPDLLTVCRRVESRGALDTAHRVLQTCGQIFRYAVATGRAERDPSGDLRGALPPAKGKHYAAPTDPKEVAGLLRMFDGFTGTFVVKCALLLAPMLFVRPGELRQAEWVDVDLDAGEWRFVSSKRDVPHIVPLSTQAVAILRDLHALTGHGRYLFPGARDKAKPMSEVAINAALKRMGIDTQKEFTGHGVRPIARTILREVLGFEAEVIELQLAHRKKDPNGQAYDRVAFLAVRKQMMQAWADYLDEIKAGAKVIPMPASV